MKLDFLLFSGTSIVALLLFRHKRYIWSAIIGAIGFFWIIIYKQVLEILGGLGVDSISEAQSFDWNEALFYLNTVIDGLKIRLKFEKLLLYITAFAVTAYLLKFALIKLKLRERNYIIVNVLISSALILISIASTYFSTLARVIENSNAYREVVDNFNNPPKNVSITGKTPTVVVYIGESTTVMNMGIYGYPRDTTPKLHNLMNSDKGILLFSNVFSTHTQTTPSLLEALSIGVSDFDNILPINERKRISIVDVFLTKEIKSYLFSNQGQAGTWNFASQIVFGKANKIFSTDNLRLGNNDAIIAKPYDDTFFSTHIISALDAINSKGGMIFLHSYAGHGEYLDYIPTEYRAPVDSALSIMSNKAINGAVKRRNHSWIDGYDSAIRYIDFSVSKLINLINSRGEPTIFIYFSDHGDSAYTSASHDASRFVHEMTRVPFIMYFNAAARDAYPELFSKYSELSKGKSVSTLAQLPATLFDVLGVKVDSIPSSQSNVIGSPNNGPISPIVVRRTAEGVTYVNLNNPSEVIYPSITDKNDDATAIFAVTNSNVHKDTNICYHASNTFAKALRGSIVADCLEFDLVVDEDGAFNINHPPQEPVQFMLESMIDIAKRKKLSLWIDAKNLNNKSHCEALATYLEREKFEGGRILVEFPSDTPFGELGECSKRIQALGGRTSYYVPTKPMLNCSRAIKKDPNALKTSNCQSLESALTQAYKSGIFTDFSFDVGGLPAMEKLEVASKLRWNTWFVPANAFSSIRPERFGMVILNSDDPNNR